MSSPLPHPKAKNSGWHPLSALNVSSPLSPQPSAPKPVDASSSTVPTPCPAHRIPGIRMRHPGIVWGVAQGFGLALVWVYGVWRACAASRVRMLLDASKGTCHIANPTPYTPHPAPPTLNLET